MRIIANKKKMLFSGEELLTLSRTCRQAGNEIDEVQRALSGLSGLEQCRSELTRQKEAVDLTTGRLVMLSSALREIAERYGESERKNEYALEAPVTLNVTHVTGSLFSGAGVHKSVERILKR